jgi:UDP-2,3-diacylglucosamine pyrophosphatase LpxH
MGLGGVWKRVRGSLRERPHNLLAVSDLHFGCDLKPGLRPSRRGFDGQFAAFLDFHAANRKDGKPWRLILNGDIVDFVAITVTPESDAGFPVSDEERLFGLGAEEAKCAWKLRQTFARHGEVFDALARFLHQGNFLHIVRGNHDAEFHWPAVQSEFKQQLANRLGLTGWARRRLEQRIEFHPWFYLEPGLFYAEHGNAHDRYSVQSSFFDPAGVTSEIDLPLSSKVLRYFANRYAEQTDLDEVDTWGVPEYIDWVLKAGNPLRVAADYFVMVWRVTYPIFLHSLKALRRFVRAADQAISQVDSDGSSAHVRRALGRFCDNEAQTRQLLAIASRPAEESLFDSMQLFYLDRALLALFSLAVAIVAIGAAHGPWGKIAATVAVAIGFAALNAVLARRRKTDSHPLLQQAARRIAQLFDVKYVVMGHSHRVVDETIGSGARYLNLGSWTNARDGFPHVAVENGVAELRFWRNGSATAAQRDAASPGPEIVAVPA